MFDIIADEEGEIIVQTALPRFNCLVSEGGGVRGAAYGGLVKRLQHYGMMEDIRYVAGSSAGAIAALIIALGYSADEIEKIMCDLPMEKFLESTKSWSITPDIISQGFKALKVLLKENHSLSTGTEFLHWIEQLVEAKLGNKNATFRDLYEVIKKNKDVEHTFKELFVTGTDISLEKPECKIFSYEATPDMPIALAVRASSSFPFVFKPVEWDGHQYIDGGLIKNLPTKIFDEKKYLPQGFGPTEKLGNPGILTVKVDTKKEIAQIIWGINQQISLKGATDIASAICNALSETVDISEVREARFVIPLEDGDIGILDFAIDSEKKAKLISDAEKTTQEFLENHANEIYSVERYATIEAWLNSQSLDKLTDTIAMYVEMSQSLKQDSVNPSISEVKDYIEFLKKYLYFRIENQIDPHLKQNLIFPIKHIDLKRVKSKPTWGELVIKDMQVKLKAINEEIDYLSRYINLNYPNVEVFQSSETPYKLHVPIFFDRLKQFVSLHDHLKLLCLEKDDLEMKLNLSERKKFVSNPLVSKKYQTFSEKINQLKMSKENSGSFKAILSNLNLYHPQMTYHSANVIDNASFVLDIRDLSDRKLFMLAARFYLKCKKSKDYLSVKAMYDEFYPEDIDLDFDILPNGHHITNVWPTELNPKAQIPVKEKIKANMTILSKMLNQTAYETLLSAYRIEELLHLFEKTECPKDQPNIDIDHLFGEVYSVFQIKEKSMKENTGKEEQSSCALKQFVPKKSTSLGGNSIFGESKKEVSQQMKVTVEERNVPKWFN